MYVYHLSAYDYKTKFLLIFKRNYWYAYFIFKFCSSIFILPNNGLHYIFTPVDMYFVSVHSPLSSLVSLPLVPN